MAKPQKPVVMVIADHARKVFSIEGPMYDDTRWTNAVADAIDSGMNINCSTAELSPAQAAAEYQQTYGYSQVPSGSIVSLKK
ncbi:hypothetical protein QN224_29905 [Sinorhizobium sp. 8-89]|uniref:hypothetical protein n=1 Tax=Sinorhizobium sp. 7-81 TaxID=3049087 RepID=UPI0024C35050|nr:hypothetical protein [Sinorhizobium sp. 7-81]MDK1389598.1 hypothetical protein [Sinorhizobium sp. 7-81]